MKQIKILLKKKKSRDKSVINFQIELSSLKINVNFISTSRIGPRRLSKDRLEEEENINVESRQCDGSLAEGSTGSPWSVKVSTKGRAVKAPSTRMIDVGSEGTGEFYDLPSGIFDRPARGCTNDDSSLHVLHSVEFHLHGRTIGHASIRMHR